MDARIWIVALALVPVPPAEAQDGLPTLLPPIEVAPAPADELDMPPVLPDFDDEEDPAAAPPPSATIILPRPAVPSATPAADDAAPMGAESADAIPDLLPPVESAAERPAIRRPTSPRASTARPPAPSRMIRNKAPDWSRVATAEESTLERKLSAQIRTAAGRRLKELSVKVRDRHIRIEASARWPWQRTAARSAIEALPAVPGHGVTIAVR